MNNPSTDSDRNPSSGPSRSTGFLQSLLGSIRPPEWVVDELQNRVVLFLNHVLMQEPAAQERLRRQKGKAMRVQWGDFFIVLAPTAAGLLERPLPDTKSELTLTLTQTSPVGLAQRVLSGDKPGVDIQGDVQLAADVAWLVDNVRWDVEEDLSRLVGDAMAHTLTRMASSAAQAVKGFAPGQRAASSTDHSPPDGPPNTGGAAR